jgi:ABC-type lipoprotein release transport system permease subunit
MLFGINTTDLMTYAGALLTMVPAVIIAAAIPAIKAARVDPAATLRSE